MKRNTKTILAVLIGLLTIFLMTACSSSSFTIATSEDFEVVAEAENSDEQSGMGYVKVEKGEVLCADAAFESEGGSFTVKIYESTEATGDEEEVEEILPEEEPLNVLELEATGVASVEMEPGEYTVVVEAAGGVTGTITVKGASASEIK